VSRQPGKKSVRKLCIRRSTLLSQSKRRGKAVIIAQCQRSEILGCSVHLNDVCCSARLGSLSSSVGPGLGMNPRIAEIIGFSRGWASTTVVDCMERNRRGDQFSVRHTTVVGRRCASHDPFPTHLNGLSCMVRNLRALYCRNVEEETSLDS
jgi:hypothetical protein